MTYLLNNNSRTILFVKLSTPAHRPRKYNSWIWKLESNGVWMCENTIKFDRFFKQWFGHLSYVNLNCNTFKWLSTLAHWHQSLVLAFSKNAGGNVPSITSKINNDWLMPGKFVRIAWANTITSPTSSWCHWQGRRTRLGCVFGMGASIALGLTVFHIVTFSIFHLAMFTPLLHLVSLQCLLYF